MMVTPIRDQAKAIIRARPYRVLDPKLMTQPEGATPNEFLYNSGTPQGCREKPNKQSSHIMSILVGMMKSEMIR
jgi:hypothetical protein